jgi:hypothetical protein
MPKTLPNNVLVIRGGLEPPATAEADRELVKLAQDAGPKAGKGPVNLPSRRAQWRLEPYASHVGVLWDPRVFEASIAWTRDSLRAVPEAISSPQMQDSPTVKIKAHAPALGGALGVLGIFCLFPMVATLAAKSNRQQLLTPGQELCRPKAPQVLAPVAIASALAVCILKFWIPLRFLRIVTGDYLGSFFLLSGAFLLLVFRGRVSKNLMGSLAPWCIGVVTSLAIVFGLGSWLDWRLDIAWMDGARWARFVPLALACLPYCLAEEYMLGPRVPQGRLHRLLLFGVWRLLIWVILVLGVLLLHSGQLLIILLALFLALFSLFQRLGMDAVRQRTGSAEASGIFGAILLAWFLAAVLPLS